MNQIKFSANIEKETLKVSIWYKDLKELIRDLKINLKFAFLEWYKNNNKFYNYYDCILKKYDIDANWINNNFYKGELNYEFNDSQFVMSIKGIYSINILSFVTNLKKNIIGNQIIPYLKKLNKSLMKQKV